MKPVIACHLCSASAASLFSTFIFYFIAQIVDISQAAIHQGAAGTAANDQDYFAFALVGIAFAAYFGVGLRSFASGLRRTNDRHFGSGDADANASFNSHRRIGIVELCFHHDSRRCLFVAWCLVGIRFNVSSILVPVAVCLLAIITFASIGIIAAAVIMIIKRGDPVTAIEQLRQPCRRRLYPIEVLPDWLQAIARLLPITYALRAMRASLTGATFSDVAFDLAALAIFCIILFPLSLLLFRYAVQWAKRARHIESLLKQFAKPTGVPQNNRLSAHLETQSDNFQTFRRTQN